MLTVDQNLRLPITETMGELCRLMLTTNVSDKTLSLYGLGPRNQISQIRSRLKELQLTKEEIELMDFHSLWATIFPKNMH